jgi:hypothetical protein
MVTKQDVIDYYAKSYLDVRDIPEIVEFTLKHFIEDDKGLYPIGHMIFKAEDRYYYTFDEIINDVRKMCDAAIRDIEKLKSL